MVNNNTVRNSKIGSHQGAAGWHKLYRIQNSVEPSLRGIQLPANTVCEDKLTVYLGREILKNMQDIKEEYAVEFF